MRIVIGTTNPTKIVAVQKVFSDFQAEFISLEVPSGVSDQPFSDEETIKGALNRAQTALELGKGDIGIGLEGGVHQHGDALFLCNWGAMALNDKSPIIAGGARIMLPEIISVRLKSGEELGPVMEDYAKKNDVRKQEGAIGIFTNGLIDRTAMFTHLTQLLLGQYDYRNK